MRVSVTTYLELALFSQLTWNESFTTYLELELMSQILGIRSFHKLVGITVHFTIYLELVNVTNYLELELISLITCKWS